MIRNREVLSRTLRPQGRPALGSFSGSLVEAAAGNPFEAILQSPTLLVADFLRLPHTHKWRVCRLCARVWPNTSRCSACRLYLGSVEDGSSSDMFSMLLVSILLAPSRSHLKVLPRRDRWNHPAIIRTHSIGRCMQSTPSILSGSPQRCRDPTSVLRARL